MPSKFVFGGEVELPDEWFAKADAIAAIKPVYEAMREAMAALGVPHELHNNVVDPKPLPVPQGALTRAGLPRRPPGRKPGAAAKRGNGQGVAATPPTATTVPFDGPVETPTPDLAAE